MLCNNCVDKASGRGIQTITCKICGKREYANVAYDSKVCKQCSNDNLVCEYCGGLEESVVTQEEIVEAIQHGEDIYVGEAKPHFVTGQVTLQNSPYVPKEDNPNKLEESELETAVELLEDAVLYHPHLAKSVKVVKEALKDKAIEEALEELEQDKE